MSDDEITKTANAIGGDALKRYRVWGAATLLCRLCGGIVPHNKIDSHDSDCSFRCTLCQSVVPLAKYAEHRMTCK